MYCPDGEVKFWLEPKLELARNYKFSKVQLKEVEKIIEEHFNELTTIWHKFFGN
jgi:uncharacterized protein DUF4160